MKRYKKPYGVYDFVKESKWFVIISLIVVFLMLFGKGL